MEERKLATIRKISKVEKHTNADSLDICTVDGWRVITKLGEFNEGDLAIYFEVDSFLPVKPEFEFLRKSSYKKLADGSEGFRLRTAKLRGEISQGLLLPVSILETSEKVNETVVENDEVIIYPDSPEEEFASGEDKSYDLQIGDDVTELLGVTKYEPPVGAILSGDAKGLFPSFLRKTDEERIQNIPWILKEYEDELVYETEKLDGTSATYYYKDEEFGVCSRNLELKEDENNLYWRIAKKYDLKNKLASLKVPMSFQGEIIGPGIQGNKYKLNDHKLYLFNIFNIYTQSFLPFEEFREILNNLDLEMVPILSYGFPLKDLGMDINTLLSRADGISMVNCEVLREGIVIKGMKEFNNIRGTSCGRLSFKVISNQFLLKEK